MVYFSTQADEDLTNILIGLATWEKHLLEWTHVADYVNDIVEYCYSLDIVSSHNKAIYKNHTQDGEFVCLYKRNANTSWYIIYNQKGSDIFIEKITNNHLTSS